MKKRSSILILITLIIVTLAGISSKASADMINVALEENGGTATADSWATYSWYKGEPSNAIDGVTDTGAYPNPGGWRGRYIPGWLEIEFEQAYKIEKVSIWFGSHQQTYSISLSLDGNSWTEVVQPRLSENIEGSSSEVPETFNIDPLLAKYIRVDITTTSAPGSHIFKSSVNELQAYANLSEWIYFSSDRAGYPYPDNRHIWRIRPDRTGIEQVTSGDVYDFQPQVSRDGTKLVFTRNTSQNWDDCQSVWVRILSTGEEIPITLSLDYPYDPSSPYNSTSPSWHPDGTKLALPRARVNRNCAGHIPRSNRIWWVDVSDIHNPGDPIQLSPVGGSSRASPNWSPDGTNILYQHEVGGYDPWAVWKITFPDGIESQLIPHSGSGGNWVPRYSPDGTRFAWMTSRHSHSIDVYVADIADPLNTQFRVTPSSGFGVPAWSPNGHKLVMRSISTLNLYTINVDGTELECLLCDEHKNVSPWWTRIPADNQDPVAQCQDVIVTTAPGSCSASASVNNGSYDPDDDPIIIDQSPTSPYSLGSTSVTLTVTDDQDATASCTATVTVVDNEAPTITCPASQVLEATGPDGAISTFSPTVGDNCSGVFVTSCSPPSSSVFPLGETPVTCWTTDSSANGSTCSFTVNVEDTTPQGQVEGVIDNLQDIVINNPGTKATDKVEQAIDKLLDAKDELAKTPPDNKKALGKIKDAVKKLESAIDKGLDPDLGADFMNQLAELSRQLVLNALDQAIGDPQSDQDKIDKAEEALAKGDTLLASGEFKDAVDEYRKALKKAEGALP